MGPVSRTILALLAVAAVVTPASVRAEAGSLQDLVGTYSIADRKVEGGWCANVAADVQSVGSLEVASVTDNSLSMAMNGQQAQTLEFNGSSRSFSHEYQMSGYTMSISGQFVRGQSDVAFTTVWTWRPQIDCEVKLTASKPAPPLSEAPSEEASKTSTTGEAPGPTVIGPAGSSAATEPADDSDDDDFNLLTNPLALIFVLLAIFAGAAYSRRKGSEPEPSDEDVKPADSPMATGSGSGGLAGMLARSVAPLSGMTPGSMPPLVAPLSGDDPELDSTGEDPFEHGPTPEDSTPEPPDSLWHKQRRDLRNLSGGYNWHDGSQVFLSFHKDHVLSYSRKEFPNGPHVITSSDGGFGHWKFVSIGDFKKWPHIVINWDIPKGRMEEYDVIYRQDGSCYINDGTAYVDESNIPGQHTWQGHKVKVDRLR